MKLSMKVYRQETNDIDNETTRSIMTTTINNEI